MRGSGRPYWQVCPFEPALGLEILDNLLYLGNVLHTVPEQALSCTRETSVSTLKVPRAVVIVDLGSPEELAMVLLDRVENVVNNIVEDSTARSEELRHDWHFTFRTADNGDHIQGFISINSVRGLLEVVQDTGDA
jgi:hypothetical protein